jgi:hypothetical protein
MGYMTVIKIQNDTLQEIRENPEKFVGWICTSAGCGDSDELPQANRIDKSHYGYFPGVQIVTVHHADDPKVIVSHRNMCGVVKPSDDLDLNSRMKVWDKLGEVIEFFWQMKKKG